MHANDQGVRRQLLCLSVLNKSCTMKAQKRLLNTNCQQKYKDLANVLHNSMSSFSSVQLSYKYIHTVLHFAKLSLFYPVKRHLLYNCKCAIPLLAESIKLRGDSIIYDNKYMHTQALFVMKRWSNLTVNDTLNHQHDMHTHTDQQLIFVHAWNYACVVCQNQSFQTSFT